MNFKYKIVPGRGLNTKTAIDLRLEFLHKNGYNISKINQSNLSYRKVQNNIESFVGTVEVPVGLVGPLHFNNKGKIDEVYTLAATLEGALVASMNRGAKAISLSNGFTSRIIHQKMIRSPLFIFKNNEEALFFKQWIRNHFTTIKSTAESYSNHATLIKINSVIEKNNVHLKFIYKTGDAAGQNMTTTCTWHAILWIIEHLKTNNLIHIKDYVLEGNGASDKKVSQFLIDEGRGIRVEVEAELEEQIIHKIFRTSSEQMLKFYYPSKKQAIKDGMVGYNINIANAIASIFLATGQDMASVHESSLGDLILKPSKKGLKVKLILYSLVIGTVGGGTHLSKQKEALKLMQCEGEGKIERFASLIAGFALGLELSTYAAMVSGEFAKAHEKLGRNKPIDWLQSNEINQQFITNIISSFIKKEISNIKYKTEGLDNGILMNLSQKVNKKLIGFIPFDAVTTDSIIYPIVIKSKPTDIELIKGIHILASSIDTELADLFKYSQNHLEYTNSQYKELLINESLHKNNLHYAPKFYGNYINEEREIFLFFQEFLTPNQLKFIDSENSPHLWTNDLISKTISAITNIHHHYHNKQNTLQILKINQPNVNKAKELYYKLIDIICDENPSDSFNILYEYLNDIIESNNSTKYYKTLIHNDFNPRNIAVRKNNEICIYDWELAIIDFPLRDIVEFLSFVLPLNFDEITLKKYLTYHFDLEKEFMDNITWEMYKKASIISLKKYLVSRIAFYKTAEVLMKLKFVDRIIKNSLRMVTIIESWD